MHNCFIIFEWHWKQCGKVLQRKVAEIQSDFQSPYAVYPMHITAQNNSWREVELHMGSKIFTWFCLVNGMRCHTDGGDNHTPFQKGQFFLWGQIHMACKTGWPFINGNWFENIYKVRTIRPEESLCYIRSVIAVLESLP